MKTLDAVDMHETSRLTGKIILNSFLIYDVINNKKAYLNNVTHYHKEQNANLR